MTILLVRVEWMDAYTGETRVSDPISPWVQDGNLPAERYNFLRRADEKFYGYLKPAGDGEKIKLQKLGADKKDELIDNVPVVFVSPKPGLSPRPLMIVGYYRSARVYRNAIELPTGEPHDTNIRIVSDAAVSIPADQRAIEVSLKKKWGSGSYRFLDEEEEVKVLQSIDSFQHTDEATAQLELAEVKGVTGTEWRVLVEADRLERRSTINLRKLKLQSPDDYECECCGLTLERTAHPAQARMFEVHHKAPISMLKAGEFRTVAKDDLAVVCANCHRAIHATNDINYIRNMDAFRRDILKLQD